MVTKTKRKSSTTKKNLVIVESPAKAKTIEKYLGRNYKVMASVGHIRDLKKSTMSIDFDNNYEPEYSNIVAISLKQGCQLLMAPLIKSFENSYTICLF